MMIGQDTQSRLREWLRTMASLELHIEDLRQQLCAGLSFDLYASFCRLDRSGDKQVSSTQFW